MEKQNKQLRVKIRMEDTRREEGERERGEEGEPERKDENEKME